MKKTLGERMRELREARDVSLREFARGLGEVSAAHISDIELGRRYPSDALLERIAGALKVSVEDLRQYDNRAPLEDLKRRAESNPTFGFALRKMVEHDIDSEDILGMIEEKDKGRRGDAK